MGGLARRAEGWRGRRRKRKRRRRDDGNQGSDRPTFLLLPLKGGEKCMTSILGLRVSESEG